MKKRTFYVNGLNIKNVKSFCTILRGCNSFEITAGNLRINSPSVILIFSLLGLRDGFMLSVCDTEENCLKIEHSLTEKRIIIG